MIKLNKKLTKVFALLVFVASAGLVFNGSPTSAAIYDLKSYYPNPELMDKFYLEGFNYRNGNTNMPRSVLWFESTGGDDFKRYNSGPESSDKRCSWDALSWEGDFLTYSQTHNDCGSNNKDVIYSSPIRFLPRQWDSSESEDWVYNSSTPVTTTKLDGSTGCTGTNTYTATVFAGLMDIDSVAPGMQAAIHWRTHQVLDWDTGDDLPDCVAGGVTNWEEDYYLIADLPVEGYPGVTTGKALKRTFGGNLDNFQDDGIYDWDIWFDKWVLLPWADPPQEPQEPQNPENPAVNNSPNSPKTGQLGLLTLILATLGAALLISALAVNKRHKKKKALDPAKPKKPKNT